MRRSRGGWCNHPQLQFTEFLPNEFLNCWFFYLGNYFFPHVLPKNTRCPYGLPTWPKNSIKLPQLHVLPISVSLLVKILKCPHLISKNDLNALNLNKKKRVIIFFPHQLPVIVNMALWTDTSIKREHPTTNFTYFAPFCQFNS